MKRQALAFFTMFSLILMLSIYYITLPKENNTTMQYESVISSLKDGIEENKEDNMIANEDIISDPNASIDEKENAILENEQMKADAKKEKEISTSILELGYENSVEVKEKTMYITVLNETENDDIAISIMKLIHSKEENNYFIEISFVSD